MSVSVVANFSRLQVFPIVPRVAITVFDMQMLQEYSLF